MSKVNQLKHLLANSEMNVSVDEKGIQISSIDKNFPTWIFYFIVILPLFICLFTEVFIAQALCAFLSLMLALIFHNEVRRQKAFNDQKLLINTNTLRYFHKEKEKRIRLVEVENIRTEFKRGLMFDVAQLLVKKKNQKEIPILQLSNPNKLSLLSDGREIATLLMGQIREFVFDDKLELKELEELKLKNKEDE